MGMENIKQKTIRASKWSSITEIIVKLVQPISNLILVRILEPEAFAAIAIINMVVSFADIFTDAGFQRYIIQRDYKDIQEKEMIVNVAFWSNLGISVFLWIIIFCFKSPISKLVGAPHLANGILIASLSLPMTSFSSIQMALLRRNFDYKVIFYARFFSAIVPFGVTIPLALMDYGYWAVVMGTLFGRLFDAVFLTFQSRWKPQMVYSVTVLKKMISFSIWSLVESISTWLTVWIGIFIVSHQMNEYYTGIYTTVINTVNSIMSIIVGATSSVLFASLSRLKSNRDEYLQMFLAFQRITAMFVLPMGIGLFVFQEQITYILLGEDWMEGAPLLGVWGLCYSFSIIFGNLISEIYRSLGRPKLSVFAQLLHIIVLAPVCFYFSGKEFIILSYARSISRVELILVHFMIVYFVLKISPCKMIKNITPYLIAATIMGVIGIYVRPKSLCIASSLISIAVCATVYFVCLLLYRNTRKELLLFIGKVLSKG